MTKRSLKAAFSGIVLAALLLPGCAPRQEEEIPRVVLAEGVVLPALSALAWLDTDGEYFAAVTEDGAVRIWEVFSGKAVPASFSGGETFSLALRSGQTKTFSLSEIKNKTSFPASGPDGTKKLSPLADGAVLLTNAAGKELARYYGLGPAARGSPGEWISIVPGGYYNASFNGDSFAAAGTGARRYSLARLSGALFRPDLFNAALTGEAGGGEDTPGAVLQTLLGDDLAPPLVSVSLEYEEPAAGRQNGAGSAPALNIKITGQKGGTGLVALYRRSGGQDIPAGIFEAENAAGKKYSENGGNCYEIRINPGPGEIGVSAFNKWNTVESERLWTEIPVPVSAAGTENAEEAGGPVLRALFAAGEDEPEDAAALREFFAREKDGELYSEVEIQTLSGEGWNRADFVRSLPEPGAEAKKNGTLVLYIRGSFDADSRGDLRVFRTEGGGGQSFSAEEGISGKDILKRVLGTGLNPLIFLDLTSAMPAVKAESALLRFRRNLGPKAMFAAVRSLPPLPGEAAADENSPPEAKFFTASVLEELRPEASAQIIRIAGSPAPGQKSGVSPSNLPDADTAAGSNKQRYIGAGEFLSSAAAPRPGPETAKIAGGFFLSSLPLDDFPAASRFINTGELRFQTMASGMLKIDRVDQNPVPLPFGETMIRALPPGSYIIDMIYRNGYRETRSAELRKNDSKWVLFTYTPPLLVGNFSALLPALGINASELNPANYEKINREAMEGMGMAPHYVAFLAGEKLYKEENYDKAIAEYTRAISLKADYAEAYASRGSAQRRKGDLDLALADYTRALNLKSGLTEVLNYRGFVYALKGDQNRAIADYTRAIRGRPGYADAYFNRAYAYGEQGDWEKAAADYTRVIQLEPSNAVAYNQRGRAYFNSGDEAKAARDYAAAEKLKSR